MIDTHWYRFSICFSQSIPMITFAGSLFLTTFLFPSLGNPAPLFPLMILYTWLINRPKLMPPVLVLGLGLLQDFLSFTPLGYTSFIFLCVYWLILTQRHLFLGKPFLMMWAGFAAIVPFVQLTKWLILIILLHHNIDLHPMVYQTLASVLIYPLIASGLMVLHRTIERLTS